LIHLTFLEVSNATNLLKITDFGSTWQIINEAGFKAFNGKLSNRHPVSGVLGSDLKKFLFL